MELTGVVVGILIEYRNSRGKAGLVFNVLTPYFPNKLHKQELATYNKAA